MTTVRQIERLWAAKTFDKLLRHLLSPRAEASARLEAELSGGVATAAMVVVRLDEMAQPFAPLYAETLRTVLVGQGSDGGWGDPKVTALCLRALTRGRGNGTAVERGFRHLALLQKDDGIWPDASARRLPADPFASAFILMQLGDNDRFRDAVRFADAVDWFDANGPVLDEPTRRLWGHAARRCGPRPPSRATPVGAAA